MNISGHIAHFPFILQKSFCSIRSPVHEPHGRFRTYPGEGLSLESSEGIRGTRRGDDAAVSPETKRG